jgi:hypothetical protein
MSYATTEDVAARLGRVLTDAELQQVPTLLDDAESIILTRIPDLAAHVAAVPPTVGISVVVRVESWSVIRFLKNPDGKYQESIDDYSFTRDKTVADGTVYISDDEWDQLLPSAGTSSAFTIRSDAGWTASYSGAPYSAYTDPGWS